MAGAQGEKAVGRAGLRRDLGALESYAVLIGILIGAGIFKVTGQAWHLTGPSVILGYVVLAPAILATSIPYSIYLSTPLGRLPGGEYTHISRTFGGYGVAFVGVWLKIISYIGALAYLAIAFSEYVVEISGGMLNLAAHRTVLAVAVLVLFYGAHAIGVRWFGRTQVVMCALKLCAIAVLVIPGLFAVRSENYRPFFTHGFTGFASALPPLFFAYAGFESLAQAAGEVKDSTRQLPRVFLKGIAATAVLYLGMSVVAFGVLPGTRLSMSSAPMVEVASVYLPVGGAWFVGLGAVMSITTALNSSMLVPSRLGIMIARDRLAPAWIGKVEPRTGTPVLGLTLTLAVAVLLVISGQVSLALNIAVFALVVLYFLHSLSVLLLPSMNPELFQSVTVRMPNAIRVGGAAVSLLSMGALIAVQLAQDFRTLATLGLRERIATQSLTAIELCVVWAVIGAFIYWIGRRRGALDAHNYRAALRVAYSEPDS
jgi:basic amino acid/polyamine antiporter, APA family